MYVLIACCAICVPCVSLPVCLPAGRRSWRATSHPSIRSSRPVCQTGRPTHSPLQNSSANESAAGVGGSCTPRVPVVVRQAVDSSSGSKRCSRNVGEQQSRRGSGGGGRGIWTAAPGNISSVVEPHSGAAAVAGECCCIVACGCGKQQLRLAVQASSCMVLVNIVRMCSGTVVFLGISRWMLTVVRVLTGLQLAYQLSTRRRGKGMACIHRCYVM